ncbi:MAG: HAMP domain-containing protein [Leptospiraceae bacterium]|nr:HAMP domain-containing protein [Leptospiraceae bacterium]
MLRRFFSFRFRLGAAIFLVSFLATLIGLVLFYHLGSKLVWKQMSDRIHDYGKLGVILLSPEDIRYLEQLDIKLHTTKATTAGATLSALTDEEKQAILRMSSHQAVMQKLRRLRQASSRAAVFDSPLLAISLPDVEPQIRRVWLAGAQLHALAPFHLRVLASDEVQEIDRNGNGKIDPEEKIYQIGDIFNGTGEKALQKALSGELALTSGYRDQASSVFITGYTPVKNAAGIVIALLIIDFSVAGEFDALFRIKVIGYYIMVGVLLISIAVAYAVSKLLLRPLEEIQLAALRIGQRDFSVRIAVQSHDELADLAEAINLLAHELGEYATHIEKRIQSRTQEIAAILSALDQGVLTLDRNGIIQPEFSAATANIFGANELAGQLFTTLFTDENLGKAVAQYLEVFFRSGKDISPTMLERANPLQRITITNLRGEKKHLRFFFRPIFSPEGEIARLLVTIIDDTAEIQLQEKIAVAEADKHTEFESLIQLVRVPLPILEEFINQQKIFL